MKGWLLLLGLFGCAAEVAAPVEQDQWSDYGAPSSVALWSAVVERWVDAGYEAPAACVLPREVSADPVMFEEICGARSGGASGCQRGSLIVIAYGLVDSHYLNPDRTRAHEMLHWLAECSGTLTKRQNYEHALENVWFDHEHGDDFVLAPWINGYAAQDPSS